MRIVWFCVWLVVLVNAGRIRDPYEDELETRMGRSGFTDLSFQNEIGPSPPSVPSRLGRRFSAAGPFGGPVAIQDGRLAGEDGEEGDDQTEDSRRPRFMQTMDTAALSDPAPPVSSPAPTPAPPPPAAPAAQPAPFMADTRSEDLKVAERKHEEEKKAIAKRQDQDRKEEEQSRLDADTKKRQEAQALEALQKCKIDGSCLDADYPARGHTWTDTSEEAKDAKALEETDFDVKILNREILNEEMWTKTVDKIISKFQKKIKRVQTHIGEQKEQLKRLLDRREELDKSVRSRKLEETLAGRTQQLEQLQETISQVKDKEAEFNKQKEDLAFRMESIKKEIAKLKIASEAPTEKKGEEKKEEEKKA